MVVAGVAVERARMAKVSGGVEEVPGGASSQAEGECRTSVYLGESQISYLQSLVGEEELSALVEEGRIVDIEIN